MATLRNRSNPLAPPLTVEWCASFFCRLRGLMFRKSLPARSGLLLVQPRENRRDASIHMLWMRMDLAVVWINGQHRVVDVRPAFRWRSFLTPEQPARYVLETPIENLEWYRIGDEITLEDTPLVGLPGAADAHRSSDGGLGPG